MCIDDSQYKQAHRQFFFSTEIMILIFCAICIQAAFGLIDTSGWVGAEYAPMQSSNEDWLFHYDDYALSIERELPMIKKVMQFTSLRVFLHSMIFETNSTLLLSNMERFLVVANQNDFTVGFVFFDDCWNHAGFSLSEPCQPIKGVHNGCWATSPQMKDRTSVDRYEPYVTEVISHFLADTRVAWWEIFNEPNHLDPYSTALRASGYAWAKALSPIAPILSCWDENEGTDLNDHHQYELPWAAELNLVFRNLTGRMQGGLVTEAGARWYQHASADTGSPLTVIDWLTKLRKNPNASFVPGVMINWEVMVSNSNTRWQWGTEAEAPEVTIPWHQHVFPDGTPVSYTEAAAIRRYITGVDDFFYFEDFLNDANDLNSNPFSNEVFHTILAGDKFHIDMDSNYNNFLLETTVWFDEVVDVPTGHGRDVKLDRYIDVVIENENSLISVRIDVTNMELKLTLSDTVNGKNTNSTLMTFDITTLDCGFQYDSWNILRLYINDGDIHVYLNPMFPDVFREVNGEIQMPLPGGPMVDILQMPPRLQATTNWSGNNTQIFMNVGESDVKIDYISILPPVLYGANYIVQSEYFSNV